MTTDAGPAPLPIRDEATGASYTAQFETADASIGAGVTAPLQTGDGAGGDGATAQFPAFPPPPPVTQSMPGQVFGAPVAQDVFAPPVPPPPAETPPPAARPARGDGARAGWVIAAVLAVILVVVAVVAGVSAARLHTRNNQLHQSQLMLATAQQALRSSQATVSKQQTQITALRGCLADLAALGTEINTKDTTAERSTILKVEQECIPLGIG